MKRAWHCPATDTGEMVGTINDGDDIPVGEVVTVIFCTACQAPANGLRHALRRQAQLYTVVTHCLRGATLKYD